MRTTRTAPGYRLVALSGAPLPRPGLIRAPPIDGPGIEVEVWGLGAAELGTLLHEVQPPLCIGTVELADGSSVLGFLCEAHAAEDAPDITGHGGWRAYLATRDGAALAVGAG